MSVLKIKKILKKEYDRQASIYDTNISRSDRSKKIPKIYIENTKKSRKTFMTLVNPKLAEKILDCGCGTGFVLLSCARKGSRMYGIDISKNMIRELSKKIRKNKIKNVKELRVSSFEKLRYKNNFFDKITCLGVMDHYPINFIKKCLIEWKRVLKFKGKIIIDFPNKNHWISKEFHKYERGRGTSYLYSKNFIKKSIKLTNLKIVKEKFGGSGVHFVLEKR